MTRSWNAAARLPGQGTFTVLEASAGTGKTYQIGGIATRLVAQEGVSIERILLITFTTAATAELRDRVRRRLGIARSALLAGTAPKDDEVIAALLAEPSRHPVYLERLGRALRDYDRTPVSTIHGFCQRTLDALAFESGQEGGLTVLGEPTRLRRQFVVDALAKVYASACPEELGILTRNGFTADALTTIVKTMTGPVAPLVVPAASPGGGWDAWQAARTAFVNTLTPAVLREIQRVFESVPIKGIRAAARPKLVDWVKQVGVVTRTGKGLAKLLAFPSESARPANLRLSGLGDSPSYRFCRDMEHLHTLRKSLATDCLADFATTIRSKFNAELSRRGLLTYDAMLSQLAERVEAEANATHQPLTTALRAQFDAVLVDEFQDTDAAQWSVIRRAFLGPQHRVFVIGDPKQAIYTFRGADLFVYQCAVGDRERHELKQNHRSDPPLVEALNHLWGTTQFGKSDIRYVPVNAGLSGVRLQGADPPAALAIRRFDANTYNSQCEVGEALSKPSARWLAAQLCAAECQRLLTSGLTLPGKAGAPEPLHPGDLAVLVYWHSEGRFVRAALAERGIPCVTGGRESIFSSEAVRWLRAWLDALASPNWERATRLLAVSPLLGWTAADLAGALAERVAADPATRTPKDWESLRGCVTRWAAEWDKRGFAALFHETTQVHRVYERLLGHTPGERGATDLRQLAELCGAEQRRSRLGPGGLSEWLHGQGASGVSDAEETAEQQSLRLESDAKAVRIVTIHACKGLEYPITLLPFGWDDHRFGGSGGPVLGRNALGEVTLSLTGSGLAPSDDEKTNEAWRQLYVAMTRARHHCVAWLSEGICQSPFQQLVGALSPSAHITDRREAPLSAPTRWDPLLPVTATATPQSWPGRKLGTRWQVASYTSLSAGLHHHRLRPDGAEPTDADPPGEGDDAREAAEGADPTLEPFQPPPSPTFATDPALSAEVGKGLPQGKQGGNWLHALLEGLDFQALMGPDGASLADWVSATGRANGGNPAQDLAVLDAVGGWVQTPLDSPQTASGTASGHLPEGFTLQSVKRRWNELPFDLSLGAGVNWVTRTDTLPGDFRGRIDPGAVRSALSLARGRGGFDGWLRAALHRTNPNLAREIERGRNPEEEDVKYARVLPSVAGLLTGSIDLVFRAACRDGQERYFVADYKSNRIVSTNADGIPNGASLQRDYSRPMLTWEMDHHAYHLQALLYTVALHRHLKLRLPAYNYDTHVGGHLYLFLKGMLGPNTPRYQGAALGVYSDRWPAETVLALDAALLGAGK